MVAAGCSGSSLVKKLSLKAGMRIWYDGLLIFVIDRSDMESKLAMLCPLLAPSGFIRVGWPKKASKRPTDITETAIRAVILPATDLVDIKVCAVDAVWSGLKLVIRKSAQ